MDTKPTFTSRLAREWGEIILGQREALELTQAELADLLGVSQGVVSKWENGRKLPSAINQSKLLAQLGIPPDDFRKLIERTRDEGAA